VSPSPAPEFPIVPPAQRGPSTFEPGHGASESPLPRGDAEHMAEVLKAIAHPKRLQLISIVQADARGETCVTELTGPLGLSQPAVSHHLKTLSEAGLMRRVRRGNWACYSLVPAVLEPVLEALKLLM
jgi:ArsR family transcriptional regulator